MNHELKEYLTDLIIEHGVTDLDSLGEYELSKLSKFVDVQEDLMNDDLFISLVGSTDWWNLQVTEAHYFTNEVARISAPLIIEQITELFDELLIANRPEDNSHEDIERIPETKGFFNYTGPKVIC